MIVMGNFYDYDVLVIGGGHAGTEAALAAARMGAKTALLTTNLDTIGQMSCNPAIGGVAKGQIVREIDALGGAMGRAIDATGIQFRVLNRSKGPAMHGPRAQADKRAYQTEIKRLCEEQPNLSLRQETVDDLVTEGQGAALRIAGVRVADGTLYRAGGRRALRRHLHAGTDPRRRVADVRRPHGRRRHARHQRGAGPLGLPAGAFQDRHAHATQRPHDRRRPDATPTRRPAAAAVLVLERPHRLPSNCRAGSPSPRPRSTP